MMDRPWRLPQGVDPCLEYLEDEEVVLRHHARIHIRFVRPHTSLVNRTPMQFEAKWQLSRTAKEGIF